MAYNKGMRIKWNEITWYSKIIALILFIALPFIGFYCGAQYGKMIGTTNQRLLLASSEKNNSVVVQNSGNNLPLYYTTPSEWQLDANNTKGGFSIAYPIDFSVQDNYTATPSTDWRVNAGTISGVKYFTLIVPKAFEPQTNFGDATLTVGLSGSAVAVTQCLAQSAANGPAVATSSITINGIPFTIFQSSDAGAGNYYETTSYRTVHGGKCYAIEYTVHSAQIANYPTSYDLQPLDETKIATLMQNIIGTFKFL
jgi:hypothetical protein